MNSQPLLGPFPTWTVDRRNETKNGWEFRLSTATLRENHAKKIPTLVFLSLGSLVPM